jgi:EAL domain-containing protein (putative c-di-GMP-specific phosphodiesterase class I)
MVQDVINELKASLHDALFLDLDDFGLETQGREVISKFIGISLKSAFQPIVDLGQNGLPIGYEALLRPTIGPETLTPQFAFEFADRQGRLVKLDRVARTLHLLNHLQLPDNRGLLFLNVHPKLLATVNAHGKVFERILHSHSVPTHEVVIELQENAIDIDKPLYEAVGNYRDRSYRIAIDSFGGRHTNLDRLWRVAPNYVKLNHSLIREAESNPKVRKVLAKLIEIIHEIGAEAVVQGIENASQLRIAQDAGGTLVQGYYTGRPAAIGDWPEHPFHINNKVAA